MKLKEGFITHTFGDEHILVSAGDSSFSGLVRSNATAAFLIEKLKEQTSEEGLVEALLEEYEVDRETAQKGVAAVLEKLNSIGALEA